MEGRIEMSGGELIIIVMLWSYFIYEKSKEKQK